ncbi:High mobility group B protein 3 [Forsythia ovata]|uniref:High mobility group B protein 3 n=1 Tax=Forsythia ovata TaxID=205694 RepID=A0ABD1UAQ9_9LAMI
MKGGRSKAETRKADSKLSVKKGAAAAGKKAAPKGKPAKDPNKPKRPASAFFVFMEDFRKQYKEKHPNNKSVAAEKAPYVAKAEKRKVEYEKTLQDYNKRMSEGAAAEEEESDKSRSEVNDEDDDEDGSGELLLGTMINYVLVKTVMIIRSTAIIVKEAVDLDHQMISKLLEMDPG